MRALYFFDENVGKGTFVACELLILCLTCDEI